ncbi:MAG: hypothetical protein JNK56_00130 [Myxococcales bacterium]|nr:hypothetical protein [Myxococcales bacterium]
MIVRVCLGVVPAVLLLAREARACEPDVCQGAVAVLDVAPVTSAAVPVDGVLVLKAETLGGPGPGEVSERVTLAVTLDGAAVAGALLATEYADLLIWRPAAPLQAGASYAVAGSVVNPGADGFCGELMTPLAFEFTAAAEPTAALGPVTTTVMATYFDDPVVTLTTLVCCDDAYPGDQTMCGVSYGATWDDGRCAATQTRGYLKVQVTGKPGAEASSASQWARVLRQDGVVVAGGVATTFQREVEAPTCFRVDQVSLASGAVAEGEEQCVGAADRERLGVRALDPALMLGDLCISDLYTCEIEDGRWDLTRCESWGADAMPPEMQPVPEASSGCGCSEAPGGAGLMGLGVLGWLGRRRRR